VASEARHRFGSLKLRIQSAIAAALCRRTPEKEKAAEPGREALAAF